MDLIDRQAAIDALKLLREQNTREKGVWIKGRRENGVWVDPHCSVCGHNAITFEVHSYGTDYMDPPFCPFCGAEMKKGEH